MLEGMQPYPEDQIEQLSSGEPHNRYTMCRALHDIYINTIDHEIKLKIRYVATLAKAVTDRLSMLDPGWLNAMYPKVSEYDELMRRQK